MLAQTSTIFGATSLPKGIASRPADGVVDLITDRFLLLSDWPRLGRARNDLRCGLRSFAAGDYVIFYRITRAGVVIHRVLHGHRDIAGIMGR